MSNIGKRLTSRDLQAIERKKQLLDSSKKLFAKNGYYNTPVRSIAQNIGSEYIFYFLAGGSICTIQKWLREGMKKPIDEIAELILGISINGIKSFE